MSEYKTIKDIELKGKRVLIRLDLNVPIKEGKITDYTRIDASLETIKYVIDHGGKAVLMSHLGRPDGQKNEKYSLKPVALALEEKLGVKVLMAPDCIGEEVEKMVELLTDGEVVLLENLRFHPGEEANDESFVSSLCSLADVYLNDAFGTAHRAHASTYGVPKRLAADGKEIGAGFLMDKELQIWEPIVEGSGNSVAIVGGAKLKEKMKAVKKFVSTFDRIITGGVVSNVFMRALGYTIGSSNYLEKDKDYTPMAKEILDEENGDRVIIPSNVVCATTEFEKKEAMNPKEKIDEGCISADVIPSADDIEAIKNASRIVWFGPMGVYEKGYTAGSLALVDAIGESKAYVVIGGGDLAAAAKGVDAKISTGGGAAIEYITSGKLDALEALKG